MLGKVGKKMKRKATVIFVGETVKRTSRGGGGCAGWRVLARFDVGLWPVYGDHPLLSAK